MTDCDALLAGIVSDPLEETRWLVLADWLEEHDDPRRAELLRLHRKMLATCCEPDAHPERSAWQARMVELLIAGVRPCVPQETLALPGGVPMTFSFIPPGAFLMGSNLADHEQPVHRVETSQGFFIGVYPVTQTQWKAVMGTDPSEFKGPRRPVDGVTWEDCQTFCAKLSEHTSRSIELPTEAEWEYACRAGTTTHYFFGDVITPDLANYDGCESWNGSPTGAYRFETTNVGTLPANAWGLHDVHGNVREWCVDWYDSYPTNEPDRKRLVPDIPYRVLRGGCWCSDPSECRSTSRFASPPTTPAYDVLSLRVCLRLS